MKRVLLAIAFGTAVSVSAASAKSLPPVPAFDDEICPQANPAGQYLNAIGTSKSSDNEGVVYAAQRLIDAYHDCASGYDRAYSGSGEPDPEDRAFSHRIYARLQLALAFQRVGTLAEQLQQPDAARAQYDGALQTIDDIERVVRKCPLSGASMAGKLVAQARDLQVALMQVESELRPSPVASPGSTVPSD